MGKYLEGKIHSTAREGFDLGLAMPVLDFNDCVRSAPLIEKAIWRAEPGSVYGQIFWEVQERNG